MFIRDKITGEMEWLPRSLCFWDGEGGGGGGEGEGGGEGDGDGDGEGAGDTDQKVDWRDGVPDDLKKVSDRFNSRDDALRAIQDLQRRDGQVRVPGKDASDEDRAAFSKAMGVPETAEGYEYPEVEEMTDAIKAEREGWSGVFHANNISKTAADAMIQHATEIAAANMEAVAAADKKYADDRVDDLKTEWGKDFERNDEFNKRAVTDIAQRAGVDVEVLKQIETKDGRFVFDHPDLSRMFALIGREMGEGRLGGVGESDRDSIETQIKELQTKAREAQAGGDRKGANKFYQEEQELRNKIAA